MPGVDRYDRAGLCEGAHHRLDTAYFLAGGEQGGSGAGRLAADVDNVGAGRQQRITLPDRAIGIKPAAAIKKAVGRDVEDTHHEGAIKGEPGPWQTRGRQRRELSLDAPRKTAGGARNCRFYLGNRRGHPNRSPVGLQTSGSNRGESEVGGGQGASIARGHGVRRRTTGDEPQRPQPQAIDTDTIQPRPIRHFVFQRISLGRGEQYTVTP
jgi:hypothetical protein